MASGGRVVAAMATVAVALLLAAGGADADCFDYCYKNCIGNDKSMADYCNYACDKTCEPGGLLRQQRPLAAVGGGALRCQIDCIRNTCGGLRKDRRVTVACYADCFNDNDCKTKTVPRPLLAGAGGSGSVRSTMEPDQPTFHEKQDAVQPASVPDDHPFHERQDSVEAPDHP